MNAEHLPSRREMIEGALRVSMTAAGSLFFSSWLSGAQHEHQSSTADLSPDPLADYQPAFFSPAEFQMLQTFSEILIPSDETPGAREARCAHFIDFVLHASDAASPQPVAWRRAMESLRNAGFHEGDQPTRLALVSDCAGYEAQPKQAASAPAIYFAYRLIKRQTIFAFYTSRQGSIQDLNYRGNSYNLSFPPCNHREHRAV